MTCTNATNGAACSRKSTATEMSVPMRATAARNAFERVTTRAPHPIAPADASPKAICSPTGGQPPTFRTGTDLGCGARSMSFV